MLFLQVPCARLFPDSFYVASLGAAAVERASVLSPGAYPTYAREESRTCYVSTARGSARATARSNALSTLCFPTLYRYDLGCLLLQFGGGAGVVGPSRRRCRRRKTGRWRPDRREVAPHVLALGLVVPRPAEPERGVRSGRAVARLVVVRPERLDERARVVGLGRPVGRAPMTKKRRVPPPVERPRPPVDELGRLVPAAIQCSQ
mmetsp:Transcript_8572/g.35324  ORF Transcript_8572/g.35324 Transcript_8572/m.35324 type:complete len:204 (+) Transcript_8572:3290-3901(+)